LLLVTQVSLDDDDDDDVDSDELLTL